MYDIKYLTVAKNKHCGNAPPSPISTIKSELIKGKIPTQKIDTRLINRIFHWPVWIFDFIKFQLSYTSQQFCEKSGFHRVSPPPPRKLLKIQRISDTWVTWPFSLKFPTKAQYSSLNREIWGKTSVLSPTAWLLLQTKTGLYIILGWLLLAF